MRIRHVVPGLAEKGNGIAVAARLIAKGQREAGHEVELVETREFVKGGSSFSTSSLHLLSEIWVHSNWWPPTLLACEKVLRAKVPLVRMTHANLDPLRYHSKFLKKLIFTPWERRLYRHTTRVVVTCEAERKWCEDWGVKGKIEVIDLKRFFDLRGGRTEAPPYGASANTHPCSHFASQSSLRSGDMYPFAPRLAAPSGCFAGGYQTSAPSTPLHVLFLGRNHPLKGVEYLRKAVEGVKGVELREVSGKPKEALEPDWQWADVLCLPTLSDNFGLVVAEALEHGKPVITTDGAPAWDPEEVKVRGEGEQWTKSLIYLRGYREGTDETRIALLKSALTTLLSSTPSVGT